MSIETGRSWIYVFAFNPTIHYQHTIQLSTQRTIAPSPKSNLSKTLSHCYLPINSTLQLFYLGLIQNAKLIPVFLNFLKKKLLSWLYVLEAFQKVFEQFSKHRLLFADGSKLPSRLRHRLSRKRLIQT